MLRIVFIIVLTFILNNLNASNTSIGNYKLLQENASDLPLESLFKRATLLDKEQGNIDSVFHYLNRIKNSINTSKDSLDYARMYALFANTHYRKAEYKTTVAFAEKAKHIYEQFNEPYKSALMDTRIGAAYQGLYKGKLALQHLKQAEKIVKDEDVIFLYLALGNTYNQLNDLEKAISYLNLANEKSVEFNLQKKYSGIIYNSLAVTYNKNNDLDKSLIYLQKTLDIAVENDNYLSQVLALHNMGWIQMDNFHDYEKAAKLLEKAYLLSDKIEHLYLKGMTYQNYAKSLVGLGEFEKANELLEQALKLYKSSNNNSRISYIYNIKATIASEKGNLQEALSLLHKSIQYSEENEIVGIVKQNYYDMSSIYDRLGDYKASLTSYKKYEQLKDSINSRKKTKEIEALKMQFEINEIEKTMELKDQRVATLENQKKASNYRNILLSVLGIGLFIFIVRQRKINNINKKVLVAENELIRLKEENLKTEMSFKNTEITEYALHISDRNRLLSNLSDKIKAIKNKASEKSIRDVLTELYFYIEEHIDINKEKIALNSKAERTEESFIYTLKNKYPKLTDKEIRVATYLLLDLPSKKIANQMGINQQSVNNYRFSIRKKLQLSKNEDLVGFLKNI